MGQLSAEARGQARLAIENVYKKYPVLLRDEVKEHIDRLRERTFKKNKRLSPKDINYFLSIENLRGPLIVNLNILENAHYVYAESCVKSLLVDGKEFDDFVIELREMILFFNRKKIALFDLPMNVHISTHFVGRLFERANINQELIYKMLTELNLNMHYAHSIILQDGLIDVAFPFLNGLAFGEIVDEGAVSDREVIRRWDINGVANSIVSMNAKGPSDSVLKIKTFLSDDMLNFNQHKLKHKMTEMFSDLKLKDGINNLIQPKALGIEINDDGLYATEILKKLFESDEWVKTCG